MAIDPAGGNGVHAYDKSRASTAPNRDTKSAPPTEEHTGGTGATDSVQLSAASRNLGHAAHVAPTGSATSASGLSHDKLRTVLDRLQSGHYDQAAVRDAIASRAASDLRAE